MTWYVAERPTWGDSRQPRRSFDADELTWSRWTPDGAGAERIRGDRDTLLLLRTEEGRALLMDAGRTRSIAENASEEEAVRHASRTAESWWQESDREDRLASYMQSLVDFGTELSRARWIEDCLATLVRESRRAVGAASTAVARTIPGTGLGRVVASSGPVGEGEVRDWPVALAHRGVTRADDVDGRSILAALTQPVNASHVAHLPVFEGTALLLTERRTSRVFFSEEWNLLEVMIQQTSAVARGLRMERNGTR